MKSFLPFILYTAIIFSLIFGGTGTLRIGPFSLRHICTLCLFFYICISQGRRKTVFYPILKFYIVYMFVYFLTNILNGEVITYHFAQSIFTYHLPCFAILLSFPLMVKDRHAISLMTKAIVGLYLFNSIITILQYYGNPVAWEIGRMIADISEDKEASLDYVNSSSDVLFGYALASGIIGFAATNGYLVASYFPLLLRHLYDKFNRNWVWDFVFAAIAIYAAFAIQQRVAFFLIALYVVFLTFVRASTMLKFIVLFAFMLIIGSNYSYDVESLGRLQDLGDGLETRERLLLNFESFLNSPYMLFGGYNAYTNHFGMGQHNTFLSAWTIGGIFTFICFVFFFFFITKKIFILVGRAVKKADLHANTIAYGVASGLFLLYSLTHSAGVQNGSPMFWVVFTMFLISDRIENTGNNTGLC